MSLVYVFKVGSFIKKRSSGGNNDETKARISGSFKLNTLRGRGGDEAGVGLKQALPV